MNGRIASVVSVIGAGSITFLAFTLNLNGDHHPKFGSFDRFDKNAESNCFGAIDNFNNSGKELTVLVKPEGVMVALRDESDFHTHDLVNLDGKIVWSSGFDKTNVGARDLVVDEAINRCKAVMDDQRTSAINPMRPGSAAIKFTLLKPIYSTARFG